MAPPEKDLRLTFRLLFSWVEKVEALLKEESAQSDGDTAAWLERVLMVARTRLEQERAREAQSIQKLGEGLQVQLGMQKELEAQFHAGKMSQQEAELAHKEFQRRIRAYRNDIDQMNAVLVARTSSELGGYIELPLQEYARELGVSPPQPPRRLSAQQVNLRIVAVAVVVGVIAVAGVAWSVLGVPKLHLNVERQNQTVRVTIENGLLRDVTLLAPWPDDTAKQRHPNAYGLELRKQGAGERRFQPLPVMPRAWTYNGVPTLQREPFSLPARFDVQIILHLGRVIGIEDERTPLEVALTDANGRVVASQRLN